MGGWANRWFGDAWALSAAAIIGPPYAILGLAPRVGPITGGQELLVTGKGFEAGANATVRFAAGKKNVEVYGTCVDDATVAVTTPSYETVSGGAGEGASRAQPPITARGNTFLRSAPASSTCAWACVASPSR